VNCRASDSHQEALNRRQAGKSEAVGSCLARSGCWRRLRNTAQIAIGPTALELRHSNLTLISSASVSTLRPCWHLDRVSRLGSAA
jgi:hypothetical protein